MEPYCPLEVRIPGLARDAGAGALLGPQQGQLLGQILCLPLVPLQHSLYLDLSRLLSQSWALRLSQVPGPGAEGLSSAQKSGPQAWALLPGLPEDLKAPRPEENRVSRDPSSHSNKPDITLEDKSKEVQAVLEFCMMTTLMSCSVFF